MKGKKIFTALLILAAAVLVFFALSPKKEKDAPPTKNENSQTQIMENEKNTYALIQTNHGDIKFELFIRETPNTAENFIKLALAQFYDGVKFHRVIKGFMIQGGDPLTKDETRKALWGTGGPGYKFKDEPFRGEYLRGTVAMANSGPDTNGSQFFIMHQDYPLPSDYVIFGKVVEGMETVDKIAGLETDVKDCPLETAVMEKVVIEE